jgi:cytidylate kinase
VIGAGVIAVDGAAGSGKSTLSRSLAAALDLPYINTGLMYRALAAAAIREGVSTDDESGLLGLLDGLRFTLSDTHPRELMVEGYPAPALTTAEVESTVSAAARHPRVRAWMRDRQREIGATGAVMEGRDIASVVFPDAAVKLFLRAAEPSRSTRRASERGDSDPSAVAEALRERDRRDARTNVLEPAPGSIVLDTDALDVGGTLEAALQIVRAARPESDA